MPAVVIGPQKELEKGGFPPAVPPHKTQLPGGVNLEIDLFKNGVIAAGIGEAQVFDFDHRHDTMPPFKT